MLKVAQFLTRILIGAVTIFFLVGLSYILLVAYVWVTDSRSSLPEPSVGQSDFSRLAYAKPSVTVKPSGDPTIAIHQLQDLVRKTAAQHGKITIAGSRHSMGGHTLLNGSLCIDMRCEGFRQIGPVTIQNSIAIVHVGAGATWHELLTSLDRDGWSVAVMQSNDDFTVGGSISVDCHGWQPNAPPIASTINGFRILLADGSVRECRRDRDQDRELFAAVCGGYGLFGVILDVDLRVVPNALYRAQEFPATSMLSASTTSSRDLQKKLGLPTVESASHRVRGSLGMRELSDLSPPIHRRRKAISQIPSTIQNATWLLHHGKSVSRARLFGRQLAATLGSSAGGRLSVFTGKLIASYRETEFCGHHLNGSQIEIQISLRFCMNISLRRIDSPSS